MEGIVSRKGDVYSYGIMVMETFTRKQPMDKMFAEEVNLKQWVANSVPHAITEVIDSKLLSTNQEHCTMEKDCLCSVMELALACCALSPEERPTMKDVGVALNKIKIKLMKEV